MLNKEIRAIEEMAIDLTKLKNKTILVTGSTGLIGAMCCRLLSILSVQKDLNLSIIALARSEERAAKTLDDVLKNGNISISDQAITKPLQFEKKVDYIIHTACPTASNTFITQPVETIQAIVNGTMNVMELAKEHASESVVYLSSMETYGQILHEKYLKPEAVGYLNPLSLRSCYPEGKRMAENLSIGYFSEYKVPVKIVRLAQTFGPGIPTTDGRVFAQFIRSALNGQDIVMFTEGGSKRMYLDTMDAVNAIIVVLLNGKNGQVYNAANPETYCSIREMAELVVKEFSDGKSKIIIDRSKDVGQYPPDNMLRLDVSALLELGWRPQYSLKEMYCRMIGK